MKDGNWIPVSKGLTKCLPKDRPYTSLEAAFSLQFDYDANKPVTIAGYSSLWQWSRGRVKRFMDMIGITIVYPKDTKKHRNQNGHIMIHKTDISTEKNEHIRLVDTKGSRGRKDISGEKKGQKKDRYRYTTSNTNTNINTPTCKNPCQKYEILDLYHTILAELPKVRVFSERRQKMLSARWKQKAKSESGLYSNTLEFWEALFKYIRESDWLMGRKSDWRANFEWIVTKKNFNKIIEGVYHRG
jgi:hypothetical protein